jgi:hypothetical protein
MSLCQQSDFLKMSEYQEKILNKLLDPITNLYGNEKYDSLNSLLYSITIKKESCKTGGGTGGALCSASMKILIHLFIMMSFATCIYASFMGLDLDKVQCFHWNPLVFMVRTQAQNFYCGILENTHSLIVESFKKPIIKHNVKSILTVSSAAVATTSIAINFGIKRIKKYNVEIIKIVNKICGETIINTPIKKTEMDELKDLIKGLTEKVANLEKKTRSINSDQEEDE